MTVHWVNYGSEYEILLTTSKGETNAVPDNDDTRVVVLNTDMNFYTFTNVKDSKYLYFHIQMRDMEGNSPGQYHPQTIHHKIISKQLLVLKYYEDMPLQGTHSYDV